MADHAVQTPPSLPPLSYKHTLIMDKLKNSVFKVAKSDPNAPLTPPQIAFIEKQLLSTFPVFHTPTHPTYSSMIENAVRELNEDDGSNEESISKYIKEMYDGLPWAHDIYVSHHLSKMCENGEIICTFSKLYTTPALIEERTSRKEQLEVRLGRKTKACVSKEGDLGGEEVVGVSGEEIGFQEEDLIVYGRSRVTRRRRSIVVEAEDDEVGGDGGGEHSVISRGQNLVVEKCNEVGVLEDTDDVTERSRVKQGSQSCVVVEEDAELEGAAGVGGEQNISISSQKLVFEKCNKVVALEDGVAVTGRRRVKQRRRSYAVVEEDDEVGGAGVVGGENDNDEINPGQNLVVGKCSEMVTQGDAVTGKVRGPSEERGGIGTVGEDHDLVNVPDDECEGKTKPELLVPSSVETLCAECKCEVTNEMVNMPNDNNAANFVFVPFDCVEKLSLNDASVLNIRVDVPEVAVNDSVLKESDIVPYAGNAPISAVSAGITPISQRGNPILICGLAVPELEPPKRKQRVYSPKKRSKACQEIRKVPFASEPSLPVADVSRILLQHAQLHELTSQRGFETKLCATLSESPKFKELPVCQSQQACASIFLEDGFNEQQERQKRFDSLHHRSLKELISVEDEENLPLHQVFGKCGKQKKHAAQILTAKAPLASEASSISGSKLHANLPNTANSVRMMTKRKEKQPPLQRRQRKLKPLDQKLCNLETDTAPTTPATESKTSPWRNRQRCVDQEPPVSLMDSTVESVYMVPQHQQQGQGEDQGSSLCFKLTDETYSSSVDGCNNQQKRGDQNFPSEPGQIIEVTAVMSSPTQHLNRQKEVVTGEMISFDTDLVTTAITEEKVPMKNVQCHSMGSLGKKPKGLGGGLSKGLSTVEYRLGEVTRLQCQCVIAGQEGEGQCQVIHHDPEKAAVTFKKLVVPTLGQSSQQLIDQSEGQSRRIPFKRKEANQDTTTTSLILQHELHWQQEGPTESPTNFTVGEMSSVLCQIDKIKSHEQVIDGNNLRSEVETSAFVASEHVVSANLRSKQEKHLKQPITQSPLSEPSLQNPNHQIEDQGQSQTDVRLPDPDVTVATFVEENVPTANHKFDQQNELVKRELRSGPRKHFEIRKEDVDFSSNEHFQLQKGLSKPEIDQNLKQRLKCKEKKSRGRPRKQKGEAADSLNLHSQLRGLSEPATGLHSLEQKKGGRGRPPKQKKPTSTNAGASSNLLLEQQAGLSEPEFNQDSQLQITQPKKKGRGRPRKQKELTEADKPVSSNLYLQSQEGESESAISPESLGKVKLLENDGFGRLWKQVEVIEEDAETSSNLHLQLHEGSKPETDQHFQQHTKHMTKEGEGGSWKQLESANEEASGALNLHVHQQEWSSGPESGQHSQQQTKRMTKNGRARRQKQTVAAEEKAAASSNLRKKSSLPRLRYQIQGSKEDATAIMNSLLGEQERQSESETYHYPQQQNKQLKMNLRRRLGKQHEETMEGPAAAIVNLNLQEKKGLYELSTYQENKQFKKGVRERLWKQQEVSKEDSAAPLTLLHELEKGLSDQEKEYKVDFCLDAEPEIESGVQKPNLRNKRMFSRLKAAPVPSDNESRDQECDGPYAKPEESLCEVHLTPETGQAMLPSEDDRNRRLKKRKLHIGGQRPRTRSLTTSSDNQSDQQQEKRLCHEHDKQQGKFEGQSRPPKEKSMKIAVVPLASKDQLRSRVKRQSQDST